MENLAVVFQKQKWKKKHMKKLSFYFRLPVIEKCLEKCRNFQTTAAIKKIEKSVQRDFTLILMKFHNFFV